MRLAVLAAILLAAPAAAHADDPPMWSGPPGAAPYAAPYAEPAPATREVSYGHQTLIADGLAVAMVATGFLQDNPYTGLAVAALGVNTYAFGAPIVHLVNRRPGNALKSLGARTGLPMLGMLAGNLLGPKDAIACEVGADCPEPGSSLGIVIGAGLGAIAAIAVDARFIARKRVADTAPQIAPTVGYGRSGLTLGVAGSF